MMCSEFGKTQNSKVRGLILSFLMYFESVNIRTSYEKVMAKTVSNA
jgi:hypothetical protein